MKHSAIHLFLSSIFFILLTGCSSSQLYSSKADIANISNKIDTLDRSFENTQQKNTLANQELLELFALQQKDFFQSVQEQMLQIHIDQNKTNALFQEQMAKNKPKKVIVYKNKQETPKLQGKFILGEEESVSIQPPGIVLRARIDTGADTSSIDARGIEEFERDGKKWVKFILINRTTNKEYPLEAEISRHTKIVQSSMPDASVKRIVVKLKLTLGDHSDLSEFTLTNREHMEFPVLIGRNVLKDIALVDVSGKDLAPLKGVEP